MSVWGVGGVIRQTFFKAALTPSDEETDVVVIGIGIGGLSGAALLARYGLDLTSLRPKGTQIL